MNALCFSVSTYQSQIRKRFWPVSEPLPVNGLAWLVKREGNVLTPTGAFLKTCVSCLSKNSVVQWPIFGKADVRVEAASLARRIEERGEYLSPREGRTRETELVWGRRGAAKCVFD